MDATLSMNHLHSPETPLRPPRRLAFWRRWEFWLVLGLIGVGEALVFDYCKEPAMRPPGTAGVRTLKLSEILADLDRQEPGWRWQDLEAARPVVPDDDNAALQLQAAFRVQPATGGADVLAGRLRDLSPTERLSDEDAAGLAYELREQRAALAEARKLADLPRGRFPAGSLDAHLDEVRAVSRLLQYDAYVQSQAGDVRLALRACLAAVNAGRSVGDEPSLAAQACCAECVADACHLIERVLAQGEADSTELHQLQSLLEQEEVCPRLVIGMRGERAKLHAQFSALESEPTAPDEHAVLLAAFNDAVHIASMPCPSRRPVVQWFIARANGNRDGVWRGLAYDTFPTLTDEFSQCDARLRCTLAALAMERYRQEQGHWPDALTDLTPGNVAVIPVDPATGERLGYRRDGDGVVVFSLLESGGSGDGIAVHLFDVKQRRQLARRDE